MLVKQIVKFRGTTVICFYLSFDLEVSLCPLLSDSLLTFLRGCGGQLGGDWRWILGQILTELKRRRDQGRAEGPKAAPPCCLTPFPPLCGSHLFSEDCAQGTGPCPLVWCSSVPPGFRAGWTTPSSSKATLLIFSPLLPSSCLPTSLLQHL